MHTETKRQVLPSGLWVIATPIGNLGDLSPRARQALQEAPRLLCEDTRRTRELLSALKITGGPKLERLDAHSDSRSIEQYIELLKSGETLALVTDAGTPAVSDPGSVLTRRALEEGITVTPLPGPSAVVALIQVAGFEKPEFSFRGFFPRSKKDRASELELFERNSWTDNTVWFESPQRILETLQAIAELPNAGELRLVAGKELTKIHERVFSGTAAQVFSDVSEEIEREGARGEWCFSISKKRADLEREAIVKNEAQSSDWVKVLHCLLSAQVSASVAARRVCQDFGAPRKEAYEMALKISGKKTTGGD